MVAPRVDLDLSEPPRVQAQGRATHGVRRSVDEFRLPDLWSLHLYDYEAELTVDGRTYGISPGLASLVPPNCAIRYRYAGPSTHLYAHLAARRADARGPLRMIMNPGLDLPAIADLMRSAVDAAPVRPERCRADVWLVLLRLADQQEPADEQVARPRQRPAEEHVSRAMAYVEGHLSEPITVPEIATACGISHHHLTRSFRASRDETVVGYLRARRIEHARRLLEQSTMSISAVAAAVGLPDLQAFNKACRLVTGYGPRALRDAAGGARSSS